MDNLNFRVKSVLNQMPEAFSEMIEIIQAQKERIEELEKMIVSRNTLPEYMKPEDVAKKIGVSKPHIYELIRQGKIVSSKCGKRWIIEGAEIQRYLERTKYRIVS